MGNPGTSHSYKQAQLAEQWDAIVIGSGIGGLTAAAMLSVHGGKRVLVLERHYVAGGFTHSFHRPGWTKPLRGKNQADVQFVAAEIHLDLTSRLVR